jgi:hypothetical protein
MKRSSKILPALAALAGLAVAGAPARAGLLPTAPTITAEGGNFRWTYNINVPGYNAVKDGDYFTIYDFGGLVPAGPSTQPAGWTYSTSMLGVTDALVNATDDASIPNLTWTYHGPAISPGVTSVTLFNFSALSTSDTVTDSQLSSVVHRDYDGKEEASITRASTPVPGTPPPPPPVNNTPEPATLLLLGAGLPLLGAAGLLRRRRARPA